MIRKWYRAVLDTLCEKVLPPPIRGADQSQISSQFSNAASDLDLASSENNWYITDMGLRLICENGLRKPFHKNGILWYARVCGEIVHLGKTLCIVPKGSTKVFHMSSNPGEPFSLTYTYKHTSPNSATKVEICGFLVYEGVNYKIFSINYDRHARSGDTLTVCFSKQLLSFIN